MQEMCICLGMIHCNANSQYLCITQPIGKETMLMLIKELCKRCGLSKKAAEYYVEQGIVTPCTMDNGYRDFSQAEAETLRKVGILRKLGLGLEEVRAVLAQGAGAGSFKKAAEGRKDAAAWAQRQSLLLERLEKGESWDTIGREAETLERERSIVTRLKNSFPGYYGRFIALHFAAFLGEPIRTAEQQRAFEEIISFLDEMPAPAFAPELLAFLEEAAEEIDEDMMVAQTEAMRQAMADGETYLRENKEALEAYMAFRDSEDYHNSPVAALKEQMRAFHETSGYYDHFIPAMRRLSPSYDEYQRQMEAANEAFLEAYPALKDQR